MRAGLADELAALFRLTWTALKALPGVGDYTANAIRAVAFDQRPASWTAMWSG
jgi:adenine-specific DNA glycosylase